MGRFLSYVFVAFAILLVAVTALWGTLALWFRLPGPDWLTMAVCGLFALSGCAVIAAQFESYRIRWLIAYALLFACLLVWWASLRPPETGNWAPDVARQVTGQIDGDTLTLTNVREFQWRSEDDFTEIWTTRTFDLEALQSVDMFLSYWGGPEMAHFILSFGFVGDEYLALSVEVRREIGSGFSPVADFFKKNTLSIVAASEQDVVGVRSNIRLEDVQLFRLQTPLREARNLLEEYVLDANELAIKPRWFNSITTNCTTVIFRMLEAIGDPRPLDWRILVNGYLPAYAYERGTLNTDYPLSELRELGRIAPRAKAVGLGPGYSAAIREGVPVPPIQTIEFTD